MKGDEERGRGGAGKEGEEEEEAETKEAGAVGWKNPDDAAVLLALLLSVVVLVSVLERREGVGVGSSVDWEGSPRD